MIVGFLQFDPQDRPLESNIKFIVSRTKSISSALVVLPEFFLGSLTGFSAINENDFYRLLRPLLEHSSDHDLAFVGSLPIRIGSNIFNRALYINKGEVVGQYDKRNLFEDEADILTPGDTRYQVFEYNQLKFSIQICFDNVDPTIMYDAARRDGINLLVAPVGVSVSFIRDILKARALENQIMAIFCNRKGYDNRIYYCGGSTIIYPDGKQVTADSAIDLKLVTISKSDLADVNSRRERFFIATQGRFTHPESFSARK